MWCQTFLLEYADVVQLLAWCVVCRQAILFRMNVYQEIQRNRMIGEVMMLGRGVESHLHTCILSRKAGP